MAVSGLIALTQMQVAPLALLRRYNHPPRCKRQFEECLGYTQEKEKKEGGGRGLRPLIS